MLKVLLVDDEPVVREGLLTTFSWVEHGIKITGTAANAIEAQRMVEADFPDVIITDIRMPEIDGIQLAAVLIQKYPLIEIIFLTGYSDFEYAKSALRLRVFDYLLKPVNEKELFDILDRVKEKIASRLIGRERYATGVLKGENSANEAVCSTITFRYVEEAKEYIRNHYMNNIDLKTIAAVLHLNPSYLSRIFSSEQGITFSEYLMECRMEKAVEFLMSTNSSINEISRMVGYLNEKYFFKIFKTRLGKTPFEYRRAATRKSHEDN